MFRRRPKFTHDELVQIAAMAVMWADKFPQISRSIFEKAVELGTGEKPPADWANKSMGQIIRENRETQDDTVNFL